MEHNQENAMTLAMTHVRKFDTDELFNFVLDRIEILPDVSIRSWSRETLENFAADILVRDMMIDSSQFFYFVNAANKEVMDEHEIDGEENFAEDDAYDMDPEYNDSGD